MTKAELEAKVADLESRLADAEQALSGEAAMPVVDGPDHGAPVWVRAQNGEEWYVEARSDVYVRLLGEGAVIIDEPTAAE